MAKQIFGIYRTHQRRGRDSVESQCRPGKRGDVGARGGKSSAGSAAYTGSQARAAGRYHRERSTGLPRANRRHGGRASAICRQDCRTGKWIYPGSPPSMNYGERRRGGDRRKLTGAQRAAALLIVLGKETTPKLLTSTWTDMRFSRLRAPPLRSASSIARRWTT